MTPSEILLKAANRVERGWCQDAFARDVAGNPVLEWDRSARTVCALSAIRMVVTKTRDFANSARAMNALSRKVGGSISGWNDKPERTQLEVATTFRELAAELSEKEAANA